MERTLKTIVGGRAVARQESGDIPRGIEVLLKKAKVDPAFRNRFLRGPVASAGASDLRLTPNEGKVLSITPRLLLERMIDNTFVPKHHVATFLRASSAAMLALVLGSVVIIPTYAGGVREVAASENLSLVDLAQARMASIQTALEQFRLDHGSYPSTEVWERISNPLEEYITLANIQDPWMRKFHYQAVAKETGEVINYLLESLGPNLDAPADNIPCPTDPELHRFGGSP